MKQSEKRRKGIADSPEGSRRRSGAVSPERIIAAILSWLVPGLGHWLLGFRVRGFILGGLLLGIFWWGEAMAQGYAVTRKEHGFLFCFQAGNGLSTLLANSLQWGNLPPISNSAIDRAVPTPLYVGFLLTTLSGVMNILLVVHVLDPRSGPEQSAAKEGGGAP